MADGAESARELTSGASTDELGSAALHAWLPAALVGVLGLAIVLVRPPLPIDETRYLEILRENLAENPFLLTLDGVPYAEKPPLLFWLGSLLAKLGIPWSFALRSIPALCSALTILFVARIGRRAGLELAGWVQAALVLPFVSLQVLLFDPLLTCAVWGALDGWTRARTWPALAWCSAAFLAKGPVAFLFLVPLLWSSAPLRPPGSRPARAALHLVPSILPLLAWAGIASVLGGSAFAHSLLWDRWAGRMVHSFAHDRPAYFYVPVAVGGFLPATPLFFRRLASPPVWVARTAAALAVVLVVFTLLSGKQAHYLLPAAPAVALLGAWSVERTHRGPDALRRGIQLELGILIVLVAFVAVRIDDLTHGSTGAAGLAYLRSGAWKPAILGALIALMLGFAIASSARCNLTQVLAGLVLALGAAALGVHRIAGELLYPHAIAAALRVDPGVPLAHLGPSKHGILELLSGRTDIEKLRDASELVRWSEDHPRGLIVVDTGSLDGDLPAGWEVTVSDVVHRNPVLVLRSVWAGHEPR